MNIEITNDTLVTAINAEYCLSLQDLYDEVANALEFPDYFGENLDALHDCLTDFAWMDREKIILIINNYHELLSTEDKSVVGTVEKIFETALEYWDTENKGKTFQLIKN